MQQTLACNMQLPTEPSRSSDEAELLDLFSRSGPVARLVLPPARALALVEFTEPQDARGAFRYGSAQYAVPYVCPYAHKL